MRASARSSESGSAHAFARQRRDRAEPHRAIDSGPDRPLTLSRLDALLTEREAMNPRRANIATLKCFDGLDGEDRCSFLHFLHAVKRGWAVAQS